MSEERSRKPDEEESEVHSRRKPTSEERWRKPNEEENPKVHTRGKLQYKGQHAWTCGEVQL
jgi:hypothetical protein